MTQDAPSATELVEAVRELLEGELLEALDGRLRFHVRVAANVLRIVERELALGPELEERERARAAALLSRDGTARELAAALARGLRDASIDARDPEVLAHVRATVREKLEIAHPGYAGDDAPA